MQGASAGTRCNLLTFAVFCHEGDDALNVVAVITPVELTDHLVGVAWLPAKPGLHLLQAGSLYKQLWSRAAGALATSAHLGCCCSCSLPSSLAMHRG